MATPFDWGVLQDNREMGSEGAGKGSGGWSEFKLDVAVGEAQLIHHF